MRQQRPASLRAPLAMHPIFRPRHPHTATVKMLKNQIVRCDPNFSEGRRKDVVDAIRKAIDETDGCKVLTVRAGEGTNRSFYTFVGSPEAVLEGAINAVRVAHKLIDMEHHKGDHPRLGALDVCPFVPLQNVTMEECVRLSKKFGKRLASELNVPVYLYGYSCKKKNRHFLSKIREGEYEGLDTKLGKPEWKPDYGPATFVPRWGATVTGARNLIIVYNVNLKATAEEAAKIAEGVKRGSHGHQGLKAVDVMAWPIDKEVAQVSTTLRNYEVTPMHIVFEKCCKIAKELNVNVLGSEIVGLVPLKVMLMAANYYIKEEEHYYGQKIQFVATKLGLNSNEEFKPDEKIFEYCMGKHYSKEEPSTDSLQEQIQEQNKYIQQQMEHMTRVWRKMDQLQEVLKQREAEIHHMHSQAQSQATAPTESSPIGYLRGAEVVAQRSFHLTSQACSFDWREYGFMLHVPEGSLPPAMTQTSVDVRVSLSGQFEFPEDSDLVSATYWLSCPHKFKKPLDVELQHCASITDPSHCSQLSFVVAKCTQKELPYEFKKLKGGTFSQQSSFGRISLTCFSGLAVIAHPAPMPSEPATGDHASSQSQTTSDNQGGLTLQEQKGGPGVQYCAQLFTNKRVNDWKIRLIVTKNLKACSSVTEREYGADLAQALDTSQFILEFAEGTISPDIPKHGTVLPNGWEIILKYDPTIERHEVDRYSPKESLRVPGCELALRWSLDGKPPVYLKHPIPLKGAKGDKYFTLYIPDPGATDSGISDLSSPRGNLPSPPPQIGTISEVGSSTRSVSSPPQAPVPGTIIDRPKVMTYLKKIGNNQDLLMVGETLGLDGNELKKNLNSETFLFDLVGDWLGRKHRVDEVGAPTWNVLVWALEYVGQRGLGSDIKKECFN